MGPRCCIRAVVAAQRRALSDAAAVAALLSGPSSSFTTSRVALSSTAWCSGSHPSCATQTKVRARGSLGGWHSGRERRRDTEKGRNVTRWQHRRRGLRSAGHLIRCVHSFKVGLEQQLYHIERCARGGGVVKGQLFVLRTRRVVQ